MNRVLASLFWKETREHVWRFLPLVVVIVGLHVWALDATKPEAGHYATPMMVTSFFVLPLGAAFIGMGAASGERSQRTLGWLQGLPLSPRLVASVKLSVGAATLIATQAVAVALTLTLLAVGYRLGWNGMGNSWKALADMPALIDTGYLAIDLMQLPVLMSVSLLVWFAALGVNSASEVRAAMIGLVGFVVVWTVFGYAMYLQRVEFHQDFSIRVAMAAIATALPGGLFFSTAEPELQRIHTLLPLVPFGFANGILVGWYLLRFGRVEPSSKSIAPTGSMRASPAWLGPPRATKWGALVWKQYRVALPVVIASVAGATCVALALFFGEMRGEAAGAEGNLTATLFAAVLGSFLLLGCCASLVSGVGLMTSELEARLAAFWQSRPIGVTPWFLTAVGVGGGLLLLFFGGPTLISESVVRWAVDERIPLALPLLLLLAFAAGVACGAVVRQPIYAILLGLGLAMGVIALAASEWVSQPDDISDPFVVVASLVLVLAAWQAVRRDWAILR